MYLINSGYRRRGTCTHAAVKRPIFDLHIRTYQTTRGTSDSCLGRGFPVTKLHLERTAIEWQTHNPRFGEARYAR
jgi:hypothetical protein